LVLVETAPVTGVAAATAGAGTIHKALPSKADPTTLLITTARKVIVHPPTGSGPPH
jgi:hypothetical protein